MAAFISGEVTKFNWNDVVPVPQNDGPNPVAAIAYSAPYRELMDYFRAVLASNEYSERTLALTEEILQHNAANYTVWHFRRNAINAIGIDLSEELDFMDKFAGDNPKNYQIWHHRREVAKLLNKDGQRELDFTRNVFKVDPKNYHAWAHRQWALQHFDIWEDELEFVEALLQDDIRNNSAWNQRWFLVHNQHGPDTSLGAEQLQMELNFCMETMENTGVKTNESAWNYIRGLAFEHPSIQPTVLSRVQEFYENNTECVFAISLLADLYIADPYRSLQGIQESCALFALLVTLDPIRAKAWALRGKEAEALLVQARRKDME